MTSSPAQRRCIVGLSHAWEVVARAHGRTAERVAGWPIPFTGIPFSILNNVFTPDPAHAKDVPSVLEAARAHGVPFTAQVWSGVEAVVGEGLRAGGLTKKAELPLMALDLAGTPSDHPDVPGIECRRVRTSREADDHHDVTMLVFDSPAAVADALTHSALVSAKECAYFVAYDGERPVATSLGVAHDDIVGIFGVTTVEDMRGRGIGARLTWAAIEEGRARGATLAYLQASEMGFPVYEKMGFEVIGSHALYVSAS